MRCPACNKDEDRVVDSRSVENGDAIRRRRECLACGRRFTTYERLEAQARLMVVKKDGSRCPFDRVKILNGLRAACGKRPIPEERKEQLVHEVDVEVHRDFDREVPSVEIGRRVASRLRELDPIAYIRFASEHLGFATLEEMQQALADLSSRPRSLPNQVPLFDDLRG